MRKKRILWKRVFLYFFILALLIGALYSYFRTGLLTIRSYDFTGVEDEYKTVLEERFSTLAKHRLYMLLPGNRVISFHNDRMKEVILETLPNTSSISIHPTALHTLSIEITHHVPLFKLDEKHGLTKEGIIYQEIHDMHSLPTITFASTTNLTSPLLSLIAELVPKVSTAIFDVTFIDIDGSNDVYLYGNDKKSAVIFSSSADVKKIWSNLVSAIDTNPLKNKLASNKNELEYLDVRFGNKIFFKFTNGVKTDIISAYATSTTNLPPQ